MADFQRNNGSVSGGSVSKTGFSIGGLGSIKQFQGRAATGLDNSIKNSEVIDLDIDLAEVEEPEKFANAVGYIAASTGATLFVGFTSILSGVLDLGEHILDGGAWVAATAGSLLGADTTSIKEFIARDLVDEANAAFYEGTDLGQYINERSAMSYDSDTAQVIRHGTEKVAVFAAATAATVCTGGAAAVALPVALGFVYGAGEKAEDVYQNKGTDTTFKDETSIFISGVGEAANWYAQGKLGEGATSLVKVVSENGLKATASAFGNMAKASWTNIKDNGILNTAKGMLSKEQILSNLKKSLLQGDNISDSVGIIGDNIADWLNGDEEFNFKNVTYAFGELIATMGLNVIFDSATDYIGALNDVSGISIETLEDAAHNLPTGGDYVEEQSLFGGSNEKKGFLSKIFVGSNTAPVGDLTTQERILRDKINSYIKQNGSANVTFNNTTEFSANLLRNIDDLSRVSVRINGGFNDLNGNFRVKYNEAKYIDRITYTGYEALAIMDRLDELQSMIDMNLPTLKRAEQIYEVLASEVPVMRDFESYADGHKVSASLRGLTDVNSVGKEGLVCAGYSQAYKELCTRCGITCDYIRGSAYNDMLRQGRPGGHAWNVVLDGNTPIPVDVTWKASSGEDWFGGSEKFVALHVADVDEWFKDYSAPIKPFDKISEALKLHDMKYGVGDGLSRLERYLNDGNINHISSNGGARGMIRQMSIDDIRNYVITERTRQNLDYVVDVMTGKYNSFEAIQRLKEFSTPGNINYGNLNVITRTGGARDTVSGIDISLIQQYLERRK